jgi:hypothetical protein
MGHCRRPSCWDGNPASRPSIEVVERALADPNLLNGKCDPSPDWLRLLLEEVELEKANQLAKDRILKQSLSIDGWRQVTPLRKVLLHQTFKQNTRISLHIPYTKNDTNSYLCVLFD